MEGRQVGLGEVAVVVCALFDTHRLGDVAVLVPQPRFLHDASASLEDLLLPRYLVGERLAHEAGGVHVLDLDLLAEPLPAQVDAHIRITAHRALFHVSVAHPEVAHDAAKLVKQHLGLFTDLHIGLGDDFEQRRARAVVIDERDVAGVDHLAGVLLEVHLVDAHPLLVAVKLEVDVAVASEGLAKLAYLIVLREVGVEVVLPVEDAHRRELAVECTRDEVAHADGFLVQGGKRPGITHTDRTDVGVRLLAEARATGAKNLGLCEKLHVDLEADE